MGRESASTTDGWFPTKDRASSDADGYSTWKRSDDTLSAGGENIARRKTSVMSTSRVRACRRVGLNDDAWGERIVARVCAPQMPQTLGAYEVRESFVRSRFLRGFAHTGYCGLRFRAALQATGKRSAKQLTAELADRLRGVNIDGVEEGGRYRSRCVAGGISPAVAR